MKTPSGINVNRVPSYQESLWVVAKNCAYNRLIKKCKNEPCGIACNNCRWNVQRYSPMDNRSVELLMIKAETAAYSQHLTMKSLDSYCFWADVQWYGFWAIVSGIIGFIVYVCTRG